MHCIIKTFQKLNINIASFIITFSSKPIRFSVESLKEIQQSDDPFTNEELRDLLDEELNRPTDEMDTDVIDFLINEII